ncbi:glycosyltransferase family 1 protein [Microbacterium sp. SLBN-146]|uniref:glycosyltransferase family 4 protein n=1 Tax=Microbacterium sp. SLBN-146 TaxID=2768457 RepID=UPI001C9302D7|nr:glycosyltransferase family 1 protein [Microbacterium sp. SLBN-146]
MSAPIWVNARFLTQPATGVQRFADQISRELFQLDPRIAFVAPPESSRPDWIPEENFIVVGRRRGHAWEQIDLPRALRRAGRPVLLNLASTAPMSYSNQIATHHDITYVRYPTSFSRPFRVLYRLIVPRFLKSSRALITVSEFSKREIASHYRIDPDKIEVVPNAVDSRFKQGEPSSPRQPYILAVSSPNEHKNFARLLAAYDSVADSISSDLLIIGKQTSSFSAQDYAAKESDRVRFTGRVSDAELIELYQGAHAFVFPSLYEGFGIPPIEAQRCGVPVASSDAASLPEVLGESVLYFNPLDTESIASALVEIDSDTQLRAALRQFGFANADRYSWRRSAERVLRVANGLSSSARPPATVD